MGTFKGDTRSLDHGSFCFDRGRVGLGSSWGSAEERSGRPMWIEIVTCSEPHIRKHLK